ncbi:MAG: squalene/phytoene synthase family protein [Pseudomonadota bacterium]
MSHRPRASGALPEHLLPRQHNGANDPGVFTEEVLANARSSFAFGLRTLPTVRRRAMLAVYAFARIADDIADSYAVASEKLSALDAWSEEVDRIYAGIPHSSVGHALADHVGRFDLPAREFHLMLDGMRMDVSGPILAPSLHELACYTRRVAGTIGQLSVRCFGSAASPHRDTFAFALADALQLTNILRDVAEDAANGRIYLPKELLDQFMVSADCATIASHERTPGVCAALGALARGRFAMARNALSHLQRAPLRPALIFMGVYEGYLDRIENAAWNSAHMSPMPRWEKLARGLRYAYCMPKRDHAHTMEPDTIRFPMCDDTRDVA